MKRIISLTAVLVLLLTAFAISAFADSGEPSPSYIYVTVSDKGTLVAAAEKVILNDADGDGELTVSDVLYMLHEAKYEGGAAAGYSAYMSDWGISLGKLWGDGSGSYSYYVNNVSCMSLADTVKDGDYVSAFVYKNADWSDTYSYFDKTTVCGNEGESITLTLCTAGYDENWNPVSAPLAGAAVTVNGEATEYVTDESGKVTLTLDRSGEMIISAVSESITLVPPACRAYVTGADAQKPPIALIVCIVIACAAVVAVAAYIVIRRKTKNEK